MEPTRGTYAWKRQRASSHRHVVLPINLHMVYDGYCRHCWHINIIGIDIGITSYIIGYIHMGYICINIISYYLTSSTTWTFTQQHH